MAGEAKEYIVAINSFANKGTLDYYSPISLVVL